jgi:hypothetical protein
MSYGMFQITSEFAIPPELTSAALEAFLAREREAASPSEAILRAAPWRMRLLVPSLTGNSRRTAKLTWWASAMPAPHSALRGRA